MSEIIIGAPAKINLTFNILGKREDGYHNIESIKQQLNVFDDIFIREANKMSVNCKEIPAEKNIALKAAMLIKEKYNIDQNVEIDIEKRIPVGAGLGGGSADAAAVLTGLNTMWNLNIEKDEMIKIASEIGCDCCFCVAGGTGLATERGDKIRKLNAPRVKIVVAVPKISIPTKNAYESFKQSSEKRTTDEMIKALEEENVKAIAANLHNDFEEMMIKQHPEIQKIKDIMMQNGALNAVMSGSGSAVFCIVEGDHEKLIEALKDYKTFDTVNL
ncbi:MAG: 4-(cytidine 5'-diphospho)-2-C-methyl-D-erythritol kinase [bacterium]|nr:4-(cytidine 5'-diphospho)-2-C-methyl-D-erythritol kinase [bacterium]